MKNQGFTNNLKGCAKGPGRLSDRRGKADLLARVLAGLNFIAWLMVLLILVVAERARPQFESFFDRCYQLDIRTFWDLEFVHYLLWITLVGVIVSIAGLVLGFVRARRRDDSSLFGLVVMGLSSLVGFGTIIYFLH